MLQQQLKIVRSKNKSLGFVPTMGALHAGHISLINQAAKEFDVIVCSIFVNPTQFNNKTDFKKYPVTIDNDILLLEKNNTHILFLPSVQEVYPNGTDNLKHYDLSYLENIMEGFYRPGHYQGVCNVIDNFLNIIQPDSIFLGQKDYQQIMVLKKMMETHYPFIKINIGETLREDDGLAMSSRNMRLDNVAKDNATVIYKALQFIKKNIKTKDFNLLKAEAKKLILDNRFDKIDYVEICDAATLLPIEKYESDKKLIILVAAFINDVRLIDNLLLN